jgi:hypothetical protein
MSAPEPWLRGPVDGFIAELQPFAHELLFAKEELARIFATLNDDVVWQSPRGTATVGYHARHCAGSTMRMLTYIRGDSLSAEQLAEVEAERNPDPMLGKSDLLRIINDALDAALVAGRAATADELSRPREVGRKRLPSTVRGLFYEIAIHTSRHVGQIATTAKLLS